MRLRTMVTGASVALGAMLICICAALVLLTTKLHNTSQVLRDSVSSVRLAERMEIDVLVHERQSDPVVRASIEGDLKRSVDEAREHATTAEQHVALDRAAAAIDAHLAGAADAADGASFQAVFASLEELVSASVAEANRAEEEARRWDTTADIIGFSAAIVMLVILAGVVWWSQAAVLRPLLSIVRAMDRFAAGDLKTRAEPQGAAELQRLAVELNAMTAKLAHQHETRARYLASVAHDLRNPLSALSLSTALIEPGRPLSYDKMVRVLSTVRRQVSRLERMVNDLLEATRIESGRLELRVESCDLRDIATAVVELFHDTSPAHDLVLELPDEPVPVKCDPLRIEQTVTNLVSNAIKYSPKGGAVRVVVERGRDEACVSVTDHGLGIAEAEIPHVWDAFRRTGTSVEGIPGVGLGLSVAKRIVEAHDGEIFVRSKLGDGSTFTMRLPAERAAVGGARPNVGDAEPSPA